MPLLLTLLPLPVQLDTLTVERARSLSGRLVVASFVVAKPPHVWGNITTAGAADLGDDVERGATLQGRRFDLRMGERATLVGQLRVIDHAGAVVNGVAVPGWAEVRVEG